MEQLITLFQSAVFFGTVIMFGAIGEILTEKAGNLNLGVPGIMSLGAIASLVCAFFYENSTETPNKLLCLLIAGLGGFLASAFGGLIYSFLTVTLRANQNVTGLTLTIFGGGVANFFGGSIVQMAGGIGKVSVAATSAVFRTRIPVLSDIKYIGDLFFSYGFLVYFAIAAAIAAQYYLSKSRQGLYLRAVGENPATADATGINVIRKKYLATCIGAGISGLGGLYYVVDYTRGSWSSDSNIEALGWLAVALVIFATWKPKNLIWGAYLFGVLYWMFFYIPGLTRSTQEIFKMLPYIVTIAVLIFTSLKNRREQQPPQSLGLPYFREER